MSKEQEIEDLDPENEIKHLMEKVMNSVLRVFQVMDITPELAVFCLDSLAQHLRKENPEIPAEFPIEAVVDPSPKPHNRAKDK